MTPQEVEAIERATIAAVSPRAVAEIGGWILAMDPGTIRRAASAAPLRHDLEMDPAVLDRIEAAFAEQGLSAAFRLCDDARLEAIRTELVRRGYVAEQPTLVKTAPVAAMRAVSADASADILERPDEGWAGVFTSDGFDPVDGANRVAALTRSSQAAYGAVREGARTLAVGVVAFGHGWASIHGMRTAKARRGKGLAGRVLAGLAEAATARGVERVFLQVEEGNAPARALYGRAGFQQVWRYFYWSRG